MRSHEASVMVMGTVGKVQIWGLSQREAGDACSEIFTLWKDVDRIMSLYKPQSDLVRLNNCAGQGPVPVAKDLIDVLRQAQSYCARTHGIFDVRVGCLMDLWGLGVAARKEMPNRDEIVGTRRQAKRARVLLFPDVDQARISRDGVKIDLGGIAKGYALDKARAALRARGALRAVLDLGGQLMLCSPPPEGWIIGVREPGKDSVVGTLRIKSTCSISVSSQEDRFRYSAGMRIGHVMDTRTGRPARRRGSVSVVTSSATQADVLSTAFLVAGRRDTKALLKEFPDAMVLRVMPVTGDGALNPSWKIWKSPGMEKLFAERKSSTDF